MSSHHQLLYHIVFSTKNRRNWLTDGFRESVFAYMAGVAAHLNGDSLRIGGFYDHVHLLVRLPTNLDVASFVGKIKANTSKHINETSGLIQKFGWQDGYGAFTVSTSLQDSVAHYIDGQLEHHARMSYQDEYLALLERHGIDYDPRYVWE